MVKKHGSMASECGSEGMLPDEAEQDKINKRVLGNGGDRNSDDEKVNLKDHKNKLMVVSKKRGMGCKPKRV